MITSFCRVNYKTLYNHVLWFYLFRAFFLGDWIIIGLTQPRSNLETISIKWCFKVEEEIRLGDHDGQ